MHELKRLLAYLGPYRRDMVLGGLLVLVETAFELFIPVLMADIIDVGVAQRDVTFIIHKGVQMAVCALLALVTGLPMTIGKFFTVGERSYNVERLYNQREGLTAADVALPGRLTKTPQDPDRPDTVVPLDKMLPVYYKVGGWDSHGVPTAKRLKHLGIPLPEGG